MRRKTPLRICPICGKEHTKRRSRCCCIEHSKELSRRNHIRKQVVEKICPKCGKTHTKLGIYCSRHCANGHIVSDQTKQKISNSINAYILHKKPNYIHHNKYPHICLFCGYDFLGTKQQKYCSKQCGLDANKQTRLDSLKKGLQILKNRGNLGGYREGSGRSKSGYYKGIYCGSTYELAWMIYQLDNNKNFSRFEGVLEWNGVKYIPDFIQEGNIVEIKGYERDNSVARKTAVANHFGYKVIVLRKNDLEKEFEWVKSHYHYHDMEELYDGYKPKYEYVCAYCKKPFTRNKKLKSQNGCCSRKCAGLLVSKR